MTVEQKLAELGLALPEPPNPLGSYTAVSEAGNLLFVSGQLPLVDGKVAYSGRVGEQLSVDDGKHAARLAALNVLAQIRRHLGGFERLRKIARVEGHVSSADGFFGQPAVIDGASDLFAAVLGDKAGHALGVLPAPVAGRRGRGPRRDRRDRPGVTRVSSRRAATGLPYATRSLATQRRRLSGSAHRASGRCTVRRPAWPCSGPLRRAAARSRA